MSTTTIKSEAITLTDAEFDQAISKGLVFIDFWASWCGPCKQMSPLVDELSGEIPSVTFYKLNVDENPIKTGEFGIRSIPTFLIFKDGQKVETFVGTQTKQTFVDSLKKYLAN